APFDDAEIVYTARESYLPLAYELAAEYEIPCTFAEGIAAHFTRPGQACLAFLRWIGEGWHAADFQRAARAGAIATPAFARILRPTGRRWQDRRPRRDWPRQSASSMPPQAIRVLGFFASRPSAPAGGARARECSWSASMNRSIPAAGCRIRSSSTSSAKRSAS